MIKNTSKKNKVNIFFFVPSMVKCQLQIHITNIQYTYLTVAKIISKDLTKKRASADQQ